MATKKGFLVREYELKVDDGYVLKLHRLVHPEDLVRGQPLKGAKKPYLLLHGLIGSSASFFGGGGTPNSNESQASKTTTNEQGENTTVKIHDYFDQLLSSKSNSQLGQLEDANWVSVAGQFRAQFEGDQTLDWKQRSLSKILTKTAQHPGDFSDFQLINFDYDPPNDQFGASYRRKYHKTRMPKEAKRAITHSLAETLANFGYDVWLLNLRGNAYSRSFDGPLNAGRDAEYWDFNLDTLVNEDLSASVNFVKRETGFAHSLGLVTYSYSSAFVLRLLTKFPQYSGLLQPIVLMAPGPMAATSTRGVYRRILAGVVEKLVGQTAPFPHLGREKNDLLMRTICAIPFAKNLCQLLEVMLHGQLKSVGNLVMSESETEAIKRDAACGQTSTPLLRDVLQQMASQTINERFCPWLSSASKLKRIINRSPSASDSSNETDPTAGRDGEEQGGLVVNRTMMLVHSRDDSVSRPEDNDKLRDRALRGRALVDYHIKAPNFGHTSFLFSERNQYLVNGEIVRMVALFDLLTNQAPKTYDNQKPYR